MTLSSPSKNSVEVYSIPGKLVGHHLLDSNTIVDSWTSLDVTFEEWKSTIYEMGILKYVPKHKVTSWITDTSNSSGLFKPEIQDFRKATSAEAMAQAGIKMYFTVLPQSALGKLSVRRTSSAYSGHGEMQSISVASMLEAFDIIKKEQST